MDLETDLNGENLENIEEEDLGNHDDEEDILLLEQNESTQGEGLNEEDFFGIDDMINGIFSTGSTSALSEVANGLFSEQLEDVEQTKIMSGTKDLGLQFIGLIGFILCLLL